MQDAVRRVRLRHAVHLADREREADRARLHAELLLAERLAESDVPCPGCWCRLRGANGERCPECGADLLQTMAARRRLWRRVPPLCGIGLAGAGTNVCIAVVAAWGLLTGGGDAALAGPALRVPLLLAAPAAASVAVLVWATDPRLHAPGRGVRRAAVWGLAGVAAGCAAGGML